MLKIKRTGIENYLPGGEQNLKLMVIGGPGVGKTRFSAGWPQPFYLNCEAGLSSVADLGVPYTDIETSEDMLQALKWLKRHPDATQNVGTVIVDTLDAFQRKVKQEWLENNANAEAFSGYDAWGYLDSKMQMLMTRLLSLPYNVVVLVHYKDKTYTEKVGGEQIEKHEFLLQLQGDTKDTAFNDFDLVGWMDTFWEPGAEGGKVEARGITFKRSPSKPFLKDRLHITDEWYKISLEAEELEGNYLRLFERFIARLDDLKDSEDVGDIPDMPDENAPSGEGVVPPTPGGPVAPSDPKKMPLDQLTKKELIEMARAIPSIADEVKTSLLKDEVIQLIEKARQADAATQTEQAEAENAAAPEAAPEATKEPAKEPAETVEQDHAEGCQKPPGHEAPCGPLDASSASEDSEPEQAPEPEAEPSTPVEDEAPQDVAEEAEQTTSDGVEASEAEEVASTPEPAEQQEKEPEPAKPAEDNVCEAEGCGKDLAGENQDYVKLAWIKFRTKLCNTHYIERKKG